MNKLESKGLITRQIDKNDRRKILVAITREGKAFAEKYQTAMIEDIAEMLGFLGEHDAREYVRIIGRLAER